MIHEFSIKLTDEQIEQIATDYLHNNAMLVVSRDVNEHYWHPASDVPDEHRNKKCVVITDSGQMYFGRTIGESFMDNVKWYMPLPELPK